jgi:Ser/Thr protein kinase RdoA (MazF antagonist)
MLPIAELVRVQDMLDGELQCPLGDAAAARWDCERALFLRSSTSHVFVAQPMRAGPRLVLRMRPELGGESVLQRSAEIAGALHGAGAPVTPPAASTAGRLVEHVEGYDVMALIAAEGEVREEDEIDPATAQAWGRLLADFHDRAAEVRAPEVPNMAALTTDPFAARLAELPRTPTVHGLLHGDPEPDNVVWTGNGGVFVDFDDVRRGWFAADVAFALRAWGPPARGPDLAAPVPAAFVAGYRERRPLSDEELSWVPLLAGAAAAETLAELAPGLVERPQPGWPPWAVALDRRVRDRIAALAAGLHAAFPSG